MTTPPFNPAPCNTGGSGAGGADVEQVVLCDLDAEGTLLGTALAVYEYDSTGNPVGAPVFVDPATGLPYVPQGTLQVCPGEIGCQPPQQFCFTSTATVDQPGRMYDLTFPLGIGFGVQGIVKDLVDTPVSIVWQVTDPDAAEFMADLQAAIQSQFAGQTVTVQAAAPVDQCNGTAQFAVHIECLRIDQSPPTLLQLRYNDGRDLILNPTFTTNAPVNDLYQSSRADVPPPQPFLTNGGIVDCTDVANRGWETNDRNRSFEGWGYTAGSPNGESPWNLSRQTTPTPRGTQVFEINAFGSGPVASIGEPFGVNPDTIWQTFVVPAAGNFTVRVVVGARTNTPGESIAIRMSTGDVNDTGIGDIINTSVSPGQVTNEDGSGSASNSIPGPWTTFSQTVPLNAGTYTLAFTGPAIPGSGTARNFGGLFTDMRVFQDAPNTVVDFTNDDDTCTVETNEATTTCEFWQPRCLSGEIADWKNVADGEILTNAEFWAQVPAPGCCLPAAPEGDGGGSATNLVHSYLVCANTDAGTRTLARVVITDPNGAPISDQFVDTSGALVTPSSWQPGQCPDTGGVSDSEQEILCEIFPDGSVVRFLRSYRYDAAGIVVSTRDTLLDGVSIYGPTGPVTDCGAFVAADQEPVCFTYTATGAQIHTGTIRHQDSLPAPGWLLFDQNQTLVPSTEPGLTFVPCGPDPIAEVGLCLADGSPIAVVTRRSAAGTVTQDGWINLTTGVYSPGLPPVGTVSCSSSQSIQVSGTFCSVDDATGNVLALILIEYEYAPDGSIASVRLVNAVDGTTYTVPPGATITTCPTGTEQPSQDLEILCADNGQFVRDYRRDETGAITGFTDYTLAGAAFVPTGTVRLCAASDAEVINLCDITGGTVVPFLRTLVLSPTGAITSTIDTTLTGAPYTVTGTATICTAVDTEPQVLCDSTGASFLRRYSYNAAGLQVGTNDTTLDGSTPFTPTGAVTDCARAVADSEQLVLCDVNAGVATTFVRNQVRNAAGAITATVNTTLAGAPYTPTGTVGVCSTTVQADTDFVEEILQDSAGTCFLRLFRFNSVTGALVSTTNTTLAGAAYTPVGAVTAGCGTCCPDPVSTDLCSNTGSGRAAAIRAANGTITLIDSVTGATLTPANIVPCPAAPVVPSSVALNAQGRVIGDADAPWTPGADVTGVLTSVTLTVLSGTCTAVDASGTSMPGLPAGYSATWNAEDHSALTGPQSIDAIGGQTVVHWTQK